jgi:DNA-binding beta-propeller fold protein YncE
MKPIIQSVSPSAGMETGEVIISCENFDTRDFRRCRVLFGDLEGRIISASPGRVIVAVPKVSAAFEHPDTLALEVDGERSDPVHFSVALFVTDQVHPVTNPAYDPESGNTYVTYSGSRGQKVPCSIYSISPLGEKSEFLHDVMNATAIAFDREGTMFVTSRYDGTVYRISPFKEAEPVIQDLGIATGLAFDHQGMMYVGDRTGTIYRVNEVGEAKPFVELEPSVSAYHLAFGPDAYLYVTGPTASSNEFVYRISPTGMVEAFFSGLGRPQGLAFDTDGNLYVAASWQGRRGIFRLTPDRQASLYVAGKTLVGLVFDDAGNMILATTEGEIHRIPLGIHGYLLDFFG